MATEYRFMTAGWRQPFDRRKATPEDYRISIMFQVGKNERLQELRLTPEQALQASIHLLEAYRSARKHEDSTND